MQAFKRIGAHREGAEQGRAFLARLDLPAPRRTFVAHLEQPTSSFTDTQRIVLRSPDSLTEVLHVVRERAGPKSLSSFARTKVTQLYRIVEKEVPRWQEPERIGHGERERVWPGREIVARKVRAERTRQIDNFTRKVLSKERAVPSLALTLKDQRYVGAHFRLGSFVQGQWRVNTPREPKVRRTQRPSRR